MSGNWKGLNDRPICLNDSPGFSKLFRTRSMTSRCSQPREKRGV